MLSELVLLRQFEDRGIRHGGEVYLPPTVAAEFVAACDENDLAAIGVEGFRRDGVSLSPLLEVIADFSDARGSSWKEYRAVCNEAARRFIAGLGTPPNLVVNLTATAPRDWRRGNSR